MRFGRGGFLYVATTLEMLAMVLHRWANKSDNAARATISRLTVRLSRPPVIATAIYRTWNNQPEYAAQPRAPPFEGRGGGWNYGDVNPTEREHTFY